MTESEWEGHVQKMWDSFDELSENDFRAQMEELIALYPLEGGAGLFETAAMWDATGRSDLAVALYESAVERGLTEERRRRAIIQLASSMRNIGRVEEAAVMLEDEGGVTSDELDDAVVAFRALALADLGRERKALSVSLIALSAHLPRYQRSLKAYALDLVDSETPDKHES